jgi:hypothetical protein
VRFQSIQYDFQLPPELTEVDYQHLKKLVTANPKLKLVSKESFYRKFQPWIIAVIICFSITGMLMIAWLFLKETGARRSLDTCLTISFIVFFFCTIALFWTLGAASFLWYIFEKNQFYRRMKRELLAARSYKEFIQGFYYDYGYFYREDE